MGACLSRLRRDREGEDASAPSGLGRLPLRSRVVIAEERLSRLERLVPGEAVTRDLLARMADVRPVELEDTRLAHRGGGGGGWMFPFGGQSHPASAPGLGARLSALAESV